jgi:hypothetical protein
MEKFPEIKEGQVVLLRADSSTGHVLDELFNLATKDNQKVYTIFNTIQEALEGGNKILNEKDKLVECTILGKNKELLYYLNPYQIK